MAWIAEAGRYLVRTMVTAVFEPLGAVVMVPVAWLYEPVPPVTLPVVFPAMVEVRVA